MTASQARKQKAYKLVGGKRLKIFYAVEYPQSK